MQVDGYGRKQWLSPRVATPGRPGYGPGSGLVMEPPQPDSSRKRLRESYSMSEERSMPAASVSPSIKLRVIWEASLRFAAICRGMLS